MHLTLHPPFLPLLSMLLPFGVQILLHIRKSLHLAINARPFPEAAVPDLLVLLEEAEFAVQGALVGDVDGELGVGFGVELFFEDGGELDVGWVSFDGWFGGE